MARNVQVEYVPLTQWPVGRERTPEDGRDDAKFKAPAYYENSGQPNQRRIGQRPIPLSQTLDDLDRELWAIGADNVVVQVDVANKNEFQRELRRDGVISANARMKSPAIVVSFTRDRVATVFATDYFKRWEDNLRAIVLGMEALRKLERYHIARAGDQYRGWQALPSSTLVTLSTEGALQIIAVRTADTVGGNSAKIDRMLRDRDYARDMIRAAVARSHPDAGGSTADFQLVQEAKRVLEAHHGGAL